MVPSIIALHWGWLKLQDVEVLVSPEEKRNLPIIEVMHSYGQVYFLLLIYLNFKENKIWIL